MQALLGVDSRAVTPYDGSPIKLVLVKMGDNKARDETQFTFSLVC